MELKIRKPKKYKTKNEDLIANETIIIQRETQKMFKKRK